MPEKTEVDVARIGVRLIDGAYLAWSSAESKAETMLRAWFQASGERREAAYLAYQAALDREEASARDLERLWSLASQCHDRVVEETVVDPDRSV
jgi:hypothetical protein